MSTLASPGLAGSMAEPLVIDVAEVAALLGCSERHIWRLSDAGKLPSPVRIGALVRWNREQIHQWVRDGCPATRKGR